MNTMNASIRGAWIGLDPIQKDGEGSEGRGLCSLPFPPWEGRAGSPVEDANVVGSPDRQRRLAARSEVAPDGEVRQSDKPLHLYRTLLVSFAASFLVCATARAEQWNALYVFGDSYSDSGAGYVDADGPTAVVYLARGLGIPFTYATDPDRSGKSLNFAVSGAKTGVGEGIQIACRSRGVTEKLLGRGIHNQVQDFVGRVQTGEIKFSSDRTLFFIAGGLNDEKVPTDVTIRNLETAIGSLYAIGARHIAVALLPTRIPSFKDVSQRLNPALKRIPEDIHLRGLDVRLSHWGEYFDEIMDHPGSYGLTNTIDACAGRALFDEDPTPRGNPSEYYYYHDGHPSTAVHRIVGESLLREMLATPLAPTTKETKP